MSETERHLVRRRAAAYDEVYAHWHAKRVTVESFERWARFFLDVSDGEEGHLNGNELACALAALDLPSLQGKRVLDYCCGVGRSSIYFALRGATVSAFDASPHAIGLAKASAALSGVDRQVEFAVMDAQDLAYPDDTFDAVYCQSAMHIIIDYPRCATELARVLKPGGRAVFCEEALGYNPLLEVIRWFRRRKYRQCGGRPLTHADIDAFAVHFETVRIHHFNLTLQLKTVMARRLAHWWLAKRLLRRLDGLDQRVLERWPGLRRFCGKVVIEYINPSRGGEAF